MKVTILSWCLLAVALFVACEQQTAIWLRVGSTREHLVFDIGHERGSRKPVATGFFAVRQCAAAKSSKNIWTEAGVQNEVWRIDGITGTANIDSVTYGVIPHGFKQSGVPARLTSGCYIALISGTGELVFDIHADGSVAERQH
jgi:hypothetical protein